MTPEAPDCGLGPAFTARRNAALAALLAPLAHRLNNGLATVIGLGELVRARPNAPAVRKLATTVDDQARGVVSLIRILSSFSKSIDGPPEKLDAAFVLGQVRELLAPVCQAARTPFEYDVPEVLPTQVVSRALLQLVVVRGVETAEDPGRPPLRIAVRRDGSDFVLTVEGTEEPGLDPDRWATHGLWIEDPHAPVLSVRFRALDAGAPHALEPTPREAGATAGAERRSVLVFERDPQLADLVATVLVEGGFDVVVTTDADETRRAAKSRAFDLLLVDEGESPADRGASDALLAELAGRAGLTAGCFGDGSLADARGLGPALAKPFRPTELLAFAAGRLD